MGTTDKVKVSRIGESFSATHFLPWHEKCSHLHGHNWDVDVTIEGSLSFNGIVVDFSQIKSLLSNILKELDHKILIPMKNKNIVVANNDNSIAVSAKRVCGDLEVIGVLEEFAMLPIENTTAEILAEYIRSELKRSIVPGYTVSIKVWENKNAFAEV
jgi:6-pyruvoyltetrahydropterin/6-carboxytetrahydropterin synthase